MREVVHELANLLDGASRTLSVAQRANASISGTSIEAVSAALDSACRLLRALPESASQFGIEQTLIDPLPDQIRHAVELLRPMANERQIELVEYADASLADVPASALHAVLVNAVRNAIEAVGTNGRIEVRALHEPDDAPERARVRIEVIDDGPGPPSAVQTDLFEAGVTTKKGSAGIGLALIRDTIRSLGGSVTLDRASDAGGARLVIQYPVPRSPVHCPVQGESDGP
jgi:signal transduction histidine kinase